MDNLIFSLNSTMPLFPVMVIGSLLKKKWMLTKNVISATENFN